MKESVLIAEKLCVDRGGQRVLDNASFRIGCGEVFALLGGNGAGKSTTLLTFLGFIPPSSGMVQLNDSAVHDDVNAVRSQVAYLPESVNLYPHLSATENLDYFLSLSGAKRSNNEVKQALDTVGLPTQARSKRFASYSKGMQQKVAIALALLRNTPVLLLDEPTSGLDPLAIDELHDMIDTLARENKTILMVTHDVYGACQVATRIGLLSNGRLVGLFEAPENGKISAEEVHKAFAKQSPS